MVLVRMVVVAGIVAGISCVKSVIIVGEAIVSTLEGYVAETLTKKLPKHRQLSKRSLLRQYKCS